ncbi:MAG: hypothetical protein EXS14_06530 [Planctomycetes bacterium]|nr:hypothetical protein [Planctomycetota bacterium]
MWGLPPSAFEFASPQRLWCLLLVPLVLVGVQMLRRRAALLQVPSLALWKIALERVRRRELRWLRRLLLLLRVLVLAGLVVLWAGPQTLELQAGRGSTTLLLDQSLGTSALDGARGTLAERVLDRARSLVVDSRHEGPVGLGFIGDGITAAGACGADAAVDVALSDPPRPRGGRDLNPVLVLAQQIAAPRRVVWISPFEVDSEMRARLKSAGVTRLRAGDVRPQAGIVQVERDGLERLDVLVRGAGELRRVVLRAGQEDLGGWPLQPTEAGTHVSLTLPAKAAERLSLHLEPPDCFPQDDVVCIALPERRHVALLLVSDQPSKVLDAYFSVSECVDHLRSGRMTSAEFGNTPFTADVVVLHGVKLTQPLPSGRYLLVDSSAPGVGLTQGPAPLVRAALLEVDRTDPLLRGLDFADLDMPAMPTVEAERSVRVIARTSAGALISRGSAGAAEYVALSCPLQRSSNNLASLPAFPLLLDAALRALALPRQALLAPATASGAPLLLFEGEIASVTAEGSGESRVLVPLEDATGFMAPEPGWWRSSTGRLFATALLDAPGRPCAALLDEGHIESFPPEVVCTSLRPALAMLTLGLLLLEWILPLLFRRRVAA